MVFATYAASAHLLNDVLPADQVLLYCLMHAFAAWWTLCAVTGLVHRVLRRWRPHQLVVLTLGMAIMSVIYAPVTDLLNSVFVLAFGLNINSPLEEAFYSHYTSADNSQILPHSVRDYAIWLGVNMLFDRYVGLPRYRYPAPRTIATRTGRAAIQEAESQPGADNPQDSPRSVPAEPAPEPAMVITPATPAFAFLHRLDVDVDPVSIVAIKAEQHYVKIITQQKNHLLLHRFGDVLAEIPEAAGVQVHRSWWVRLDAIDHMHHSGRRMKAILKNGVEVPVSSPHQTMVRKLAAQHQVPVLPGGCH